MSNASTTATTSTANITSAPNVHYTVGTPAGQTFTVVPHEPSPR